MDSLTDRLICGLMTCFFRLFDWLIDWLFIWLVDWSVDVCAMKAMSAYIDWRTIYLFCFCWLLFFPLIIWVILFCFHWLLFFSLHLLESLATLSGCQRVWYWDPAAARTPGGAEQVTRGEAGELSDAARLRRHPWWWRREDDGTQTEGTHCFAWTRSAFVTEVSVISWANLFLLLIGREWTNIEFKAKQGLPLHKYWQDNLVKPVNGDIDSLAVFLRQLRSSSHLIPALHW